jgi:methylmalonyl-CoA/ethylmalonyl-CoA epimerase
MAVNEFRVALTVDDYEAAIRFYRDGLGLESGDQWFEASHRGEMFMAGKATLEVFEPGYAKHVDKMEVGDRVSGQIRFAFEVPDLKKALKSAKECGATLVAEPRLTPWGDLNARIQSPEGLQVTLYQVQAGQS